MGPETLAAVRRRPKAIHWEERPTTWGWRGAKGDRCVLSIAVPVLAGCGGGGTDRTTTPRATDVIVDAREVAVRTFGGFGAEWGPVRALVTLSRRSS